MQNNTPFSRDLHPDLTRTIRDVIVNEDIMGKALKKLKRFTQGLTTGGDGPPSPADQLRSARWKHAHRSKGDIQRAYMKHKARATVKEEQEYIERLESVLLTLCEELELNPDTLLEDYQTLGRQRETKNDLKNLKRKQDERLKEFKKVPKHFMDVRGLPAGTARHHEWSKLHVRSAHDIANKEKQQSDELKSGRVYGKGGKIIKRKS